MPPLAVRRPSFGLDRGVAFQWQPDNPRFGLFANAFSFIAVAFERYIASATSGALPLISDPDLQEEASTFLRQEASHARAHRSHVKALTERHPGLAATAGAVHASYDRLLRDHDLQFHLAYIADLEATFTPLFKMVLDHRRSLFEGGDERVGTMLLWHFVEEIEHRSSALAIHRHLSPDPWYRVRRAPAVFGHVESLYRLVLAGFEAHVPLADRHIPTAAVGPLGLVAGEVRSRIARRSAVAAMLGDVPAGDLRSMAWQLLLSQGPRYDPGRADLPAWAQTWHRAYDSGADITSYAGAGL